MMAADRVIRWSTAGVVIGVAAVAAVASYEHACDLVRAHGKAGRRGVAVVRGAVDEHQPPRGGQRLATHIRQISKVRERSGNRSVAVSLGAAAKHLEGRQRVPPKSFYQHKRHENKLHVQALFALARRLVDVLWALLRDNRTWSPVPPSQVTATAA